MSSEKDIAYQRTNQYKELCDYSRFFRYTVSLKGKKNRVGGVGLNNTRTYRRMAKRGLVVAFENAEFLNQLKSQANSLFGGFRFILVHSEKELNEKMREFKGCCNVIIGFVYNCYKGGEYSCPKIDFEEITMKFDYVFMNPPYAGKGDPLYMHIVNEFYDNCLTDEGKIVAIHPTSVVDTMMTEKCCAKYVKHLMVEDFYYGEDLRAAFGADIGTGIGVFVYSKKGTHTLQDDYIRGIRFGENTWKMRKEILKSYETPNNFASIGFVTIQENKPNKRKDVVGNLNRDFGGKKYLVVLAFNHGHINKKDGGIKSDWICLQSEDYLKVQKSINNMKQYIFAFNTMAEAVNFIKWTCTDYVGYFVLCCKSGTSNPKKLIESIPLPPNLNGDFSDEVLMKHFNITKEKMEYIHAEMKNFGWKATCGNVSKEMKLANTYEKVVELIEERNK